MQTIGAILSFIGTKSIWQQKYVRVFEYAELVTRPKGKTVNSQALCDFMLQDEMLWGTRKLADIIRI